MRSAFALLGSPRYNKSAKVGAPMDKTENEIMFDLMKTNNSLLVDLIGRVAKLEGKYSWVAGFFGALGGLIAAVTLYLMRG